MTTMPEFAAEIEFRVRILHGPEHRRTDGWDHHHYQLRVSSKHHPNGFGTSWEQGLGIKTRPDQEPESVLDSLILDATSFHDAASFENFCDDFGYDPDSRRTLSTWNKLHRLTPKVIKLVGGDLSVAQDVEAL